MGYAKMRAIAEELGAYAEHFEGGWETMGRLQEYVVLTEALDGAVEQHIAGVEAADPAQADTLRAGVLFPVRQKHQDLLTQLAVCAQGYSPWTSYAATTRS